MMGNNGQLYTGFSKGNNYVNKRPRNTDGFLGLKHKKKYNTKINNYELPRFSKALLGFMTNNQKKLALYLSHFQKNIRIKLYNKDFKQGTLRIKKPGIYILQENIIFHPNSDNDFMPYDDQINVYPNGGSSPKGAYHLGFFAAITIETKGVILDLNGKTIQQSKEHYLEQRFYANIELASSPFVMGQGPGNFGTQLPCAENTIIKNGVLGLSSHHGIHGNQMKGIIFQNLTIKDFDVAGVSLNGGTNIVYDNVMIKNSSVNVPVTANYSQARFARRWLEKAILRDETYDLNVHIGKENKDLRTIQTQLNTSLQKTKDFLLNNIDFEESEKSIFVNSNKNQGLDGNVYGIAHNVNGVLVKGFLKERLPDAECPGGVCGNQEILIFNTNIFNIKSHPVEIIALSKENGEQLQKGTSGEVINITKIQDNDGKYDGDILSDTQFGIAATIDKTDDELPLAKNLGTTCITNDLIDWAKTNSVDSIDTIMNNGKYQYKNGLDLMAHVMKGNIGLLISGGKNVNIINTTIDGVKVWGSSVGSIESQGGDAHGLLLTASTNVVIKNTRIKNVKTENIESSENNGITSINNSDFIIE